MIKPKNPQEQHMDEARSFVQHVLNTYDASIWPDIVEEVRSSICKHVEDRLREMRSEQDVMENIYDKLYK